ncbi:S8 family serine peptidase [Streptomyces sp. NPDC101151]|uniref:S8 family serine peptidase n=1 Tax=Streptomyces sp. NPDC101151 TaxID=3366115 RepID=UPI0038023544
MGDPVDEHYVAASGTSTATPHVAGAVAPLARRHPDGTGARVKDALISTARTVPGRQVTEQGGGRIDTRAAALGSVTATGGLALGPFSTGDGAPAPSRLRYTNTSPRLGAPARHGSRRREHSPPDGAARLRAVAVDTSQGNPTGIPGGARPVVRPLACASCATSPM